MRKYENASPVISFEGSAHIPQIEIWLNIVADIELANYGSVQGWKKPSFSKQEF